MIYTHFQECLVENRGVPLRHRRRHQRSLGLGCVVIYIGVSSPRALVNLIGIN